MKKVVLFLMLCASAFMLTGCGSEEKTMSCSRSLNQNGVEISLDYTVKYKGKYVTSVKSEEKVKSDSEEYLETLKSTLETQTSAYKDIKYYDIETKIDGNTLINTITINYEKIDTDKLIEIDSSVKQLIKDGKVAVDDIEKVYEAAGITCEKK